MPFCHWQAASISKFVLQGGKSYEMIFSMIDEQAVFMEQSVKQQPSVKAA